MSEEVLQRKILENPIKIGEWNYYNFGATTIKQMLKLGIIPQKNYGKFLTNKVDGLIIQGKNNVIAVIEYKTPQELNSDIKIQKTINQEIEVARQLAKLYIITDTEKTIWINAINGDRILDQNGNELTTKFDYNSPEMYALINTVIKSIDKDSSQIKIVKRIDPTDLAHTIWQDVWSVSGASPENCLYTFVELFIFKYLSDLSVLTGMYSFYYLIKLMEDNTDEDVLEYYAGRIRPKIKELFPKGIDNTTIINGTIFVSKDQKAVKGYSTVFVKILNRFYEYGVLQDIDYDFKSKLFESFLKESISKKNWGQFFTPLKVVKNIIKMAEIRPGDKICDPACGVGKFLLEPMLKNVNKYYSIKDGKILRNIEMHGFDKGFDHDEQKTIILAKANMLIYFSDLIKKYPDMTEEFGRLFNDTFILKTNSILGTLAEPVEEYYDLILTNPPYVMSGSSNLKEEIKKSNLDEKYYKINAMGVEGLFMEWIIRALKPGGKAFIIVPDGIFNRTNDKKLREFIINTCYVDAIISLPKKTFFSTPKKTYIMVITKKEAINVDGIEKLPKQTNPVFTYIVSSIGETLDVDRFDIPDNDLENAVELFNQYKGLNDKSKFEDKDLRCKIQSIDKFYNNDSWLIDRWWSEEELINLGISEKENVITPNEFKDLINEIADTIVEYTEPITTIEKKKLNYVDVSLSNEKIFKIDIGKRVLKKEINAMSGNIPLYSSNVNIPFGFVNFINMIIKNNNYIIWGLDGNYELNIIDKGIQFSTTDHCGYIEILDNNINPYYVMNEIEKLTMKYKFDRSYRPTVKRMKELVIKIPESEGKFDLDYQTKIANNYKSKIELENKVNEYIKVISSNSIEVSTELDKYKLIPMNKLFDLTQKTNNSSFTKKFVNKNSGDIPVYGASMNENEVGYGYIKDSVKGVKYFNDCLTWNIDGTVGVVHNRKGRFSLSEKVIPLILQKEYENINKEYLKYEIEIESRKRGFSFGLKGGKSRISDINIKIPICQNGEIDYKLIEKIVKKHEDIKKVKKLVLSELEKAKVKIDFTFVDEEN